MGELMSQCKVKGAIHTYNSLLLLDNITSLIHLNYKLKRLAVCKEARYNSYVQGGAYRSFRRNRYKQLWKRDSHSYPS